MKMGREAHVAEFLGTFALVFFGSVSATIFTVVLGFSSPASSILGIAIAYGLVLMVMTYAIGYISGCHINPATTITAMAIRKLDADDGIAYLVAQVLGATSAGWAHALIPHSSVSALRTRGGIGCRLGDVAALGYSM